MGSDGIHIKVLKELADAIAEPLLTTYQRSWKSGDFQGSQKLPNITPRYRKSVREGPGNYRPVSLTSVPGKTTEKLEKQYTGYY